MALNVSTDGTIKRTELIYAMDIDALEAVDIAKLTAKDAVAVMQRLWTLAKYAQDGLDNPSVQAYYNRVTRLLLRFCPNEYLG